MGEKEAKVLPSCVKTAPIYLSDTSAYYQEELAFAVLL
jgi:hypothetical protein